MPKASVEELSGASGNSQFIVSLFIRFPLLTFSRAISAQIAQNVFAYADKEEDSRYAQDERDDHPYNAGGVELKGAECEYKDSR
jgi:hypothetical protein